MARNGRYATTEGQSSRQRRVLREVLPDLGRLFLAGEAFAPAAHGGDELREVDLERVQDLVGVVLGAQTDLALPGPRLFDDVLGCALGLLGDLLLGDHPVLALARLLHDPLGLAL